MATHYDTLGLSPDATPEAIKAAYRALSRQFHPDKAGGVTNADFKRVAEAYATLRDPKRRLAYDQTIQMPATVMDFRHQEAVKRLLERLLPQGKAAPQSGQDTLSVHLVAVDDLRRGGEVEVPGLGQVSFSGSSAVTAWRWGRVPRAGRPGINGGEPGDLRIILLPNVSTRFQKKG